MKNHLINLLFASLICGLAACTGSAIDIQKAGLQVDNPLRFQIEFATPEAVSPTVRYWHIAPEKADSVTLPEGTQHQVTLLGLLPHTTYQFQVGWQGRVQSEIGTFTTGAIPDSLLTFSIEKGDSTAFDQLIFLRRFYKKGVNAFVDAGGKAVWYDVVDTVVQRSFVLTDQQTILSLEDSFVVAERDLFGNELLKLDVSKTGFQFPIHHEVMYHPNGNLLALSWTEREFDLSKAGLSKQEKVKTDALYLFDRQGKIVWEWSTFDVANPADDPQIKQYYRDWGHANSVAIDQDGHYLISFRDFSQVWKINSENGALIWKLGKGGDFQMPESSYFIGQHGAHINSEGHLMLFDNGEAKIRPESRVLSFALDEEKKLAQPQIMINLGKEFTSFRMCSAYLLTPDRILVCTTRKDATLGVFDIEGNLLWKMKVSDASFRAYPVPDLFPVAKK